ncbi:5-methylcytosine restriction system specificity protein McrC [Blastococcus sp. SYSU DS0541]
MCRSKKGLAVVTRPELTALSEGQSVYPVDLTPSEATALNSSRLVTVEPDVDGWRVTAEYAVGALQRGNLVVRVAPKVGTAQVLTLLARAHGISGLKVDPGLVGLADDADLSSVLAVLFAQEVATAMAAGPLRGYRTEDQTLPVLRGRVRLRDQHLRRFGLPVPLEVTVDEWTLDTDDNRRIRAACRRLLTLADVPAAARNTLLRLDRVLTDVHLPAPGVRLTPWQPTRLNARLHRLLHLCDLVLTHTSVEHAAGDTRTHGFVVNMAWLFEKLVGQLLGEQLPGLVTQQPLPLDTLGRLTIEPDLVLYRNDRPVAVADTKYKLLDGSGKFPNADAYQLVTYCSRLGLRTGHLIYAAGDPHPEPFDIVGTDVTLLIHAVDISRSLPETEVQVADLARVLLATSAANTVPSI